MPSDLSFGTLEGRLLSVVRAFPVGILNCFFQHGAIIHEGMVPKPGIRDVHGLFHKGEYLAVTDGFFPCKKVVDKYPPDVRFDENGRLIEGEHINGRSRGLPDSRKFF